MNVLFEFSNNPFVNDLSSQYARMALSISMENKVTVIYKDDAIILSKKPFDISISEIDFFDHERFLIEQEVDIFVFNAGKIYNKSFLKETVINISKNNLDELYNMQDIIFRN